MFMMLALLFCCQLYVEHSQSQQDFAHQWSVHLPLTKY